jgi:DNA-binding response OmpR family regulator
MLATEKRVLVADDEVAICQLVRVALENHGYVTASAYDGLETLDKVREWNPHLLVLDIMLPKLDGWNVVSELRAQPETADLPVIMLTALTQSDAMVNSIMSGADVHLVKPFNPDELISIVDRLCPLTG